MPEPVDDIEDDEEEGHCNEEKPESKLRWGKICKKIAMKKNILWNIYKEKTKYSIYPFPSGNTNYYQNMSPICPD